MTDYLTGTPDEERVRQQQMLDALTDKFTGVITSEIERASEAMLESFEATGAAPNLPDDHMAALNEIWAHMSNASVLAFGNRILTQGAKSYTPYTVDDGKTLRFPTRNASHVNGIETKEGFADFFARLVVEYIAGETIRRRITSVGETTRTRIVDAIQRGNSAGLGTDAIAGKIRKQIPQISRTRAHIIARTETHGAANYGANETAKATGLDLDKEWVSSHDRRTRDFGQADGKVDEYDHRSMDGQVVPMDSPFLMPWSKGDPIKCMYPGDATLPAAASINCRCASVHIVKRR